MAAAPGALLSAVTDNRINEFVFKAVLHVLVYAYMELAAIVIERPGTELVYVTVVILQDLFHGPGVTGAGRLDHCKGQRLLMFSIYIERILKEEGPENFKAYALEMSLYEVNYIKI